MKKEYLNPQIHVVKIATMTVLAQSLTQSTKSATVSGGSYSNSLSGELFEGSDDGEEW